MAVLGISLAGRVMALNSTARAWITSAKVPDSVELDGSSHPFARICRDVLEQRKDGHQAHSARITLQGRRYLLNCSEWLQERGGILVVVDELAHPLDARHLRDGFTARESEIITRMLLGRATEEICDELDISKNTLKFHLSHIFQKTETRSRAELLARFVK
jgi:DNA-binding CsgD family transcriptional regulator